MILNGCEFYLSNQESRLMRDLKLSMEEAQRIEVEMGPPDWIVDANLTVRKRRRAEA